MPPVVSNVEISFLHEALKEKRRIDGRHLTERRKYELYFGSDWGSAYVSLGETRVLSQVSCSITEPRATRPNEGILCINVELPPNFESSSGLNQSDESVELNRLLERVLGESRCLDMESLCIVAEEKVWTIRLDVHVLNHEGNLADAASVAGLAALSHFKRPDVTLSGHEVTIHSFSNRDPVRLSVHHYPICTTFAFFNLSTQKVIVTDPSLLEERVMEGKIVFGINPYREICTLHLAGRTLINKADVITLANRAANTSEEIVNIIKKALIIDENNRKSGLLISFGNSALKSLKTIYTNEESPMLQEEEELRSSSQLPVSGHTKENDEKYDEELLSRAKELREIEIREEKGVVEVFHSSRKSLSLQSTTTRKEENEQEEDEEEDVRLIRSEDLS